MCGGKDQPSSQGHTFKPGEGPPHSEVPDDFGYTSAGHPSPPEFPVSVEHTFSSPPPAQHPESLFVDEHLSLPVTPACRRL